MMDDKKFNARGPLYAGTFIDPFTNIPFAIMTHEKHNINKLVESLRITKDIDESKIILVKVRSVE